MLKLLQGLFGRAKETPAEPVRLVEVDDAAAAGPLFFNAFRDQIPTFPRHFILVHEAPGQPQAVLGYIHQTPFHGAHLCGGMVVDAWAFRKLPEAAQACIRERGGMAEWLLRGSFAMVQPSEAIFGYIGDRKAKIVDLRVGFVPIEGHPYLHVVPMPQTSPERLAELTRLVTDLGPF